MAIAAGGIAGAFARHGTGMFLVAWVASPFPWGTLSLNICGSLLLGLLMPMLHRASAPAALRAGLTVGFCGGFTTFSAFAYETVTLARDGSVWLAGAYMAASLFLGPSAAAIGLALGSAASSGPPAPSRRFPPTRDAGARLPHGSAGGRR